MSDTQREKNIQHMARWHALSTEEQKREFLELTRSPYWEFLPEDIQFRIIRLLPKQSTQ